MFAAELNGDTAAAHALFNKIQVGAVTDEMTVREIAERDWSGLAGSGKVHAALDGLEQCNIARRDKRQHPTGGRPSNIIRIHPDLRKK